MEAEEAPEKLTQIASELAKTHAEYEDKLQVGWSSCQGLDAMYRSIIDAPCDPWAFPS